MSEARAFLSGLPFGANSAAHCHMILGGNDVRTGQPDAAATEFTAASALAEADHHASDTSLFSGPAQAALASLAMAKGDLKGAFQAYQKAVDLEATASGRARYLYYQAELAEKQGDAATRSQIIARLTAEAPGSPYTTKLVGHEVLPPRDI